LIFVQLLLGQLFFSSYFETKTQPFFKQFFVILKQKQ